MEVPATLPSPAALIPDDRLRDLPDSQLAARINEVHAGLLACVGIAISAGFHALHHAVALGQIFSEAFRRHHGEFGTWLEGIVARTDGGTPKICLRTALNYRTLWDKRDKLFPADGSEPPARNLTEAYIKVGILPASESLPDSSAAPARFRVAYRNTGSMETWSPAELRALLEETEQVAIDRQKAAELLALAA